MKKCLVYRNLHGGLNFELEDTKTITFDDLLNYIKEFNKNYIDPFDVLSEEEYERLLDLDEIDFKELEINIVSKDLNINDYIFINDILFNNWFDNYAYCYEDVEIGGGSPVSIYFNLNS